MPVYYTKDHEWINYNPSTSIGRVGITQHAATQLGDIVFVELPNIDQDIEANTSVGSIESVKAVGEIISPASGAVVELNTDLESSPETVSDSPEADGWLYDIKVSNEAELSELMNKEKYDAYVEESH
ncbi:glycine cleavage system H protein [Ramicandelaber brevisporus]|nr:glycine cleavage system H protein [Ramicandelaber brevisporus]